MSLISLCCTCYNHEKFIPELMNSVQSQSIGDWELNVVDDCSTDGSFALLQSYAAKDARIHAVRNDRNRHVCYSGNRSVAMAKSDLVSILSCDDLLLPDKFRHDVAFFEMHPAIAALYTYPQVIAADGGRGVRLDEVGVFERLPLLQSELFGRNVLSIPGLTLRKRAWDAVGGYNPLLRMTQDHELHLKILRGFEVARSEVPTVRYRRHENNLSTINCENLHALVNESVYFLSEHYLRGLACVADMKAVVPEWQRYGNPSPETIPYFLARHAFDSGSQPEVRVAGLMALARFMSDPKNCTLLERDCNFLPKDLMMMFRVPTLEAMKDLSRARESLQLMSESFSYRLGLMLTYPFRKLYRAVRPLP